MEFYTLSLGNLGTNCYVLADEKTQKAAIIDAPDQPETILTFLAEKGYTLTDIVLTHGHFDHILALPELMKKTNATLSAHENSIDFLKDSVNNLCHYAGVTWTPVIPDVLLKEGDVLTLGGEEFRILHTPGHTVDSICLYGAGILLAGDTLFQRSIGRADHPTGDYHQEIASIQEKLMVLPDDVAVYPGHGPATTIGEERRGNPYLG